MDQVVQAVEMMAAANRLLAKFWTELVSQLARQVWADTAREMCRRGGIKRPAMSSRNHNGTLGDLAAKHGRENVLGILVEMVVSGARGYGGDRARMTSMRGVLGLPESEGKTLTADVCGGGDEELQDDPESDARELALVGEVAHV